MVPSTMFPISTSEVETRVEGAEGLDPGRACRMEATSRLVVGSALMILILTGFPMKKEVSRDWMKVSLRNGTIGEKRGRVRTNFEDEREREARIEKGKIILT